MICSRMSKGNGWKVPPLVGTLLGRLDHRQRLKALFSDLIKNFGQVGHKSSWLHRMHSCIQWRHTILHNVGDIHDFPQLLSIEREIM
jgi:hypothetical protein